MSGRGRGRGGRIEEDAEEERGEPEKAHLEPPPLLEMVTRDRSGRRSVASFVRVARDREARRGGISARSEDAEGGESGKADWDGEWPPVRRFLHASRRGREPRQFLGRHGGNGR